MDSQDTDAAEHVKLADALSGGPAFVVFILSPCSRRPLLVQPVFEASQFIMIALEMLEVLVHTTCTLTCPCLS